MNLALPSSARSLACFCSNLLDASLVRCAYSSLASGSSLRLVQSSLVAVVVLQTWNSYRVTPKFWLASEKDDDELEFNAKSDSRAAPLTFELECDSSSHSSARTQNVRLVVASSSQPQALLRDQPAQTPAGATRAHRSRGKIRSRSISSNEPTAKSGLWRPRVELANRMDQQIRILPSSRKLFRDLFYCLLLPMRSIIFICFCVFVCGIVLLRLRISFSWKKRIHRH